MFVPVERATVLYQTGNFTSTTAKHLLIVLTNQFGPANQVLLVPVCTTTNGCDRTCLLNVGDHSFIQHESYIAYHLCRVERGDGLVNGVNVHLFTDMGLLDASVFERVLSGLQKSQFTKPFAKEFLVDYHKSLRP